MKIEEGRDYRTRDGRKVHITERALENDSFWGETSDGGLWRWFDDGAAYNLPSGDLDLVAEWTDPEPHVRDDPEWRPMYRLMLQVHARYAVKSGAPYTMEDTCEQAAMFADAAVREGRKR